MVIRRSALRFGFIGTREREFWPLRKH